MMNETQVVSGVIPPPPLPYAPQNAAEWRGCKVWTDGQRVFFEGVLDITSGFRPSEFFIENLSLNYEPPS